MSLVHDLLDQAHHLATREPRRPRQASLRRAVSAAYYALFHLLVRDAARFLVAGSATHRRELRAKLERSFAHATMAKAADQLSRGSLGTWSLSGATISAPLRNVGDAFVALQKDRHEADYSRRVFSRSEVLGVVGRARRAVADWKSVRDTPEGEIFRLALLGLKTR